MSYLLDTNVVSEWVKPRPDSNVIRWFASVDEDTVCLSVITFTEITQGIEEMPAGRRRNALGLWLERDLFLRFERRVIPIDISVATSSASIAAQCRKAGRPLHPMDAFVAATARVHDLSLVTRNTRHFEATGIALLNPWI